MKPTAAALIPALLFSCVALAAEEEKELPEIVVEASRGSVLSEHFAGSSSVIDEKKIAESGSRSVADLLAAEAGIRITSTSGNASGGAIHLRGFGENSSSRVLLLMDGQPINRADMAAVSLLEIPISRVEKIEVLRGSQTARFGDHAVGGVINFVTKKATGKPAGFLEAAGGSDGYSLIRGGYAGRFSGNGIALDFERNFSDGWRQNAMSELETASLRWDREIFPGSELRAGVSWAEELGGFPGPLSSEEYKADPRQSIYTFYGVAEQYFSEQKTLRGDSTLLLGKMGDWSFEIPAAFSQRNQRWNFGPGSHTDNLLETFSIGPVARFSKGKWSAEAGVNWRRDSLELDQFAELDRENRTSVASLSRDVAGVFSSVNYEFADDFYLNIGARFERSMIEAESRSLVAPNHALLNFKRDGDEWNDAFQVGLRWENERGISSWLRYDRLYRLPSTDEIASYQGYPLTVPFNDELKAETGHNLELGGEYEIGGWRFRLNGFAQWLEGEIAYDYLRNLNVNFAETRRFGIESDVGYQGENWEANVHYSWLNAEFESGEYAGKQVYLVPNHEVSATLAWHPIEEVTLQAEYQFTGASFEGNDFENEREKLPSYGVGNLLVRYQPKPGLSIYLRMNNITDERYATVKYSGVWYPAAGRHWHLGVRHEF